MKAFFFLTILAVASSIKSRAHSYNRVEQVLSNFNEIINSLNRTQDMILESQKIKKVPEITPDTIIEVDVEAPVGSIIQVETESGEILDCEVFEDEPIDRSFNHPVYSFSVARVMADTMSLVFAVLACFSLWMLVSSLKFMFTRKTKEINVKEKMELIQVVQVNEESLPIYQ